MSIISTLVEGFKPNHRIGVGQNNQIVVCKRKWCFLGWNRPKNVTMDRDHVFSIVVSAIKTQKVGAEILGKLDVMLTNRKARLQKKIASWWRRLFLTESQKVKIQTAIVAIENLRKTLIQEKNSPEIKETKTPSLPLESNVQQDPPVPSPATIQQDIPVPSPAPIQQDSPKSPAETIDLKKIPFKNWKLSWEKVQEIAPEITYLDLTESRLNNNDLATLLSEFPNLKHLLISNEEITELPALPTSLEELDCSDCPLLQKLPALPAPLTVLTCKGCSELKELPNLPVGLTNLDCGLCKNLKQLPDLPTSLIKLNCRFCSSLEKLPPLPHSLTKLYCWNCTELKELPLLPEGLTELSCWGCVGLKKFPTLPPTLTELSYGECTGLEEQPKIPKHCKIFKE